MRPFFSVLLTAVFLCPSFAVAGRGVPPPVPGVSLPAAGAAPYEVLKAFVGLPYREDGVLDEKGRWSLFADPAKIFSTPGANCSGFVLTASRILLGRNITPAQAAFDRAGDSGPGSAMGEDWDFGWDVICSISEGFSRALLLPGGGTADPAAYDGRYRGWELNSARTWDELLPRIRPGRLYLLSFSKNVRKAGYTLMHYHVGLLVHGPGKSVLLFQTSSDGGKANVRDLATRQGLESLHRDFADQGQNKKMIAVIEVVLP